MLPTSILVAVANAVLLAISPTVNRGVKPTTSRDVVPSVFASTRKIDAIGSAVRLRTTQKSVGEQFEEDDRRLMEMRSRSLDELLALAKQMELKWRRLDWNLYGRIMIRICSEISNRGLNDPRVREQSRHFARIALSHANMYSWEHEAALVGALGYERPASDDLWIRERRETTAAWLRAWERLEKEFDPTFDANDRKNRHTLQVWPPHETGLRPGAAPSAIKDPKLRAQYVAALAENKRKAERAEKQFPLIARGPSFRSRAEYVLTYLYSQQPFRNNELKRYLGSIRDVAARKRILDAVQKNSG